MKKFERGHRVGDINVTEIVNADGSRMVYLNEQRFNGSFDEAIKQAKAQADDSNKESF